MKFAAIDIGSNAVRLLIARPLEPQNSLTPFKAVEVTRLPLRLGDDVFKSSKISKKKEDLLLKAMKAFEYLTEIYNVDGIRACATSAMRDASNSKAIRKKIKESTGIQIEVISGLEESLILQKTILTTIKSNRTYLHIDVGGGSTEITLIKNKQPVSYESFNIGTVRMMENAIDEKEKDRMAQWLSKVSQNNKNIRAIGTGGNIVKLNSLGNPSSKKPFSYSDLKRTTKAIIQLNHDERVYQLKLNPDRAQVIDKAGKIFIDIMKMSGIDKIWVPNKGLKDGILLGLWQDYLKKQKSK